VAVTGDLPPSGTTTTALGRLSLSMPASTDASRLTPLREARRLILDSAEPLGRTEVAIDEGLDCVLIEDIVAEAPVPSFANTAMDGYAVRSQDTTDKGALLRVRGTIAAGLPVDADPLRPGEAFRIMTGAPLPQGADGIAIVERVEVLNGGTTVRVLDRIAPGDHIRQAGSDIAAGDVVLHAGAVLGPAAIGVAASLGRATVAVHRRPVVGVLSTGDELCEPPRPLGPGQIRDSNRHVLVSLLRRDGYRAVDCGIARDTEPAVREAIVRASRSCDVLVTSGGVSMGDFDEVRHVLGLLASETGGAATWLQIAIRPAKPLSFARLPRAAALHDAPGRGDLLILGLPGNPVSSMVSYELFARPLLARLSGSRSPVPVPERAITRERLSRRADGKLHFVRAVAYLDERGTIVVRPLPGQSSHQLAALAKANCLVLLEDGSGVEEGAEVEILRLGEALEREDPNPAS